MKRKPIALDLARIRELFDTRSHLQMSGVYEGDPNPEWNRLRERGPLHEGTPGRLIGFEGPELWFGLPEPDRRHFTAFDFATCDAIVRNSEAFQMSPPEPQGEHDNPTIRLMQMSMLTMDGARHRRYRELVQPSFNPDRMPWWTDNWARPTIESLIDSLEANGRADLNVEFCAAIPLHTICGSFGISTDDALDIRAAVKGGGQLALLQRLPEILGPIVEARRAEPRDDLISVLVQAELTDENGDRHVLSDLDILSFSWLLLSAGSGARWMPTDPVFSRFVHEDVDLNGVSIPKGSVVHQCYGAANRDPSRWERPDEFDPAREPHTHLGFGRGAHVCLGKNLARAESVTAIAALVDRLPGLRIDPDAEPPQIIGLYERAPTAVPVGWG
ncbi:MAG: cytochrome P450 [Gemmatimonadales bacterium]